jgi:hypothetical protein
MIGLNRFFGGLIKLRCSNRRFEEDFLPSSGETKLRRFGDIIILVCRVWWNFRVRIANFETFLQLPEVSSQNIQRFWQKLISPLLYVSLS